MPVRATTTTTNIDVVRLTTISFLPCGHSLIPAQIIVFLRPGYRMNLAPPNILCTNHALYPSLSTWGLMLIRWEFYSLGAPALFYARRFMCRGIQVCADWDGILACRAGRWLRVSPDRASPTLLTLGCGAGVLLGGSGSFCILGDRKVLALPR